METSQESFECVICLEVSEHSVLSECCYKLFCSQCAQSLQDKNMKDCPNCRKKLKFKPIDIFVKRLIGNLEKICELCDYKTTVSEFKYHEIKCPKKIFTCPAQGCDGQYIMSDKFDHILTKHRDDIIKMFDSYHNLDDNETLIKKQKVEKEKQIAKVSQVNKVNVSCPGRHKLTCFTTDKDGFGCDLCSKRFQKGKRMAGCRICNWDTCFSCIAIKQNVADCPNNHGLKGFKAHHNGFKCDICRQRLNEGDNLSGCRICDVDYCDGCINCYYK